MFRRRFIPLKYGSSALRPVGQIDHVEDLVAPPPEGFAREPAELAEEPEVPASCEVGIDRDLLRHDPIPSSLGRVRVDGPAVDEFAQSRTRRQTIEIVVVFPAPFGPRRLQVSPGVIDNPTSSTADAVS